MRTHVDTAAAIRLGDTDLFLRHDGSVGKMRPDTVFLEEDAPETTIDMWFVKAHRAVPGCRPELVRVTRVIDVLDVILRERVPA